MEQLHKLAELVTFATTGSTAPLSTGLQIFVIFRFYIQFIIMRRVIQIWFLIMLSAILCDFIINLPALFMIIVHMEFFFFRIS